MRLSGKSKHTIIIATLCAACFLMLNTAQAGTGADVNYSNGLLSVKAVKTPLLPVLESIGKAAGVEILVSQDLKPGDISIEFVDEPIEKGLKRLLTSFNHVIIYEKKEEGVRATVLKVYPKGESTGPLVALKTQGNVGGDEATTKPGKIGKRSEHAFSQTTSFQTAKPLKSGLLTPNRYETSNKQSIAASMGKRLEIQEQGAYKEINVLKAQISRTRNKEKEKALTFVLLDKLEKLEKLQHLNRNKMEAFHRIELFNENKKGSIK